MRQGRPPNDWLFNAGRFTGQRGVVQTGTSLRKQIRDRDQITLPEPILRLAQREYENRFGGVQPYEQMQERGGLSVMEVITLLADLAERHGATPTEPVRRGSH